MIQNSKIDLYRKRPIVFEYLRPSEDFIAELNRGSELTLLSGGSSLFLDQTYFKAGYEGCSELTFTRKAVADRLQRVLDLLSPQFGRLVMDAYRSLQNQQTLFDHLATQLHTMHPSWNSEQIFQETRKYVVHPDEKDRFALPPHQSGGAIDLGLQRGGERVEFGSVFDDPSEVSATAFFERPFDPSFSFFLADWEEYRQNRRILFHTLVGLGFTNYRNEWWHYDLGDCMWAAEFGIPWVFGSLEPQVKNYAWNV